MKLSEVRASKLLTVQALARTAGVSPGNLYKIEHGAWLPSLKLVGVLSGILEVAPGEVEEFQAAIDKAARRIEKPARD